MPAKKPKKDDSEVSSNYPTSQWICHMLFFFLTSLCVVLAFTDAF